MNELNRFKILILAHKMYHSSTNKLQPSHSYNTLIYYYAPRSSIYLSLAGHRRTSYQTAALWNALPDALKLTQGGVVFRVALRKQLLESRDQLTKKLKSLYFNTKNTLHDFQNRLKMAFELFD